MRKIYIDSNNHCHVVNDGTMIAVETEVFDGKCDAYIEGHCYEIMENAIAVYMWKPYSELNAAQREYERRLLKESQTELSELKSQQEDLLESYMTGVNSI